MTKKDKLIKRFLNKPKYFTYEELITLLSIFGFEENNTGKTGGSRRKFINQSGLIISIHKPHPHNILKHYQIEQIIDILNQDELL